MFTVVTKSQKETFKNILQAEKFINNFYNLNAGVVTLFENDAEIAKFNNNTEKYLYFRTIAGTVAERKYIKAGGPAGSEYVRYGLSNTEDQ